MKKVLFSCAVLISSGYLAQAQAQKAMPTIASTQAQIQNVQTAPSKSNVQIGDMYFHESTHDFGTLVEGPSADHTFEFVNKGKEPIIISNAQASCGCTTPSYSKDPILPGKKGTVKVSYNTSGRVAPFTKTITLTTNAGVKVLTIKGEVEKAPVGSVPENRSMMKN